ncbi:MAG TPA: hypothetical protein ENJ82_08720 [Bacteroidetes bacterium]|nr:hypothetical protein [Bacteroidota bacterium]
MKTINSVSQPTDLPALKDWKAMLGNSLSQMIAELSADQSHYDSGRAYEKLKNLTWLHQPDSNPAHFYFEDDHLRLIYLNISADVVQQLSPTEMFAALGQMPPKDVLRSRAGKLAQHYAYPKQGIAFSVESDMLVFIELFPPMSRSAYLEQIYQDPGPFKL